MRGTLLVAALFVLLAPACSATQPIVPVVTIAMSPSSVEVTSPPNQTVMAFFNGTVTVDKLPGARLVVTLSASVDVGWACALSPSTMIFTNENPQTFICNVTVPGGTQSQSAMLTVEGRGISGGLQSQPAAASSIIIVEGTTPTNKTGGTGGTGKTGTNQTTGGGTGTDKGATSGKGIIDMKTIGLLAGVIAVAAGGSGAYMVVKRRKTRRKTEDGPKELVEDVQAE